MALDAFAAATGQWPPTENMTMN